MEAQQEIWKDVVGYEDYYQVSNFGKVCSKDRTTLHKDGKKVSYNGTMLTACNDTHGYLFVTLSINGKSRKVKVHRLVAIAFIPNPRNKPEIDHVNAIRHDNRVSNLRWVTRHENNSNPIFVQRQRESQLGKRHSEQTKKKIGEKSKGHRLSYQSRIKIAASKNRPVEMLDLNGCPIMSFDSILNACSFAGVTSMAIINACNGRTKTSGGYKWRYKYGNK